MSNTPQKWFNAYATPEELRFFIGADRKSGLIRSSFDYRSTQALAKEGKLTLEEVERIVAKQLKAGVVVASTNKDDHYAYWERADAVPKKKSVAKADKDERVKKAKKP